jgi:fibronectin-binding autotransporter adhesin
MSLRPVLAFSIASLLVAHSASAATYTWDGATNSNWDTTTLNWSGSAWITNTTSDQAIFGSTGIGTISLTTAINANKLTFSNAGYTISGNTLTLGGTTPTLQVDADAEIDSVIAGSGGFTKTGNGILTLGGVNTYSGNSAVTTVNAGTIVVGPNSKLYGTGSDNATSSMIVINAGATVKFSGWGYDTPGAWGALDDNKAGKVINGGTIVYTGGDVMARGNWTIGAAGATFQAENTTGTWGWDVRTSTGFNSGWDDLSLSGSVTFSGSGNGEMRKQLIGSGSLTKDGTGTWIIGYSRTDSGVHDATYAGNTAINNGTLKFRSTGSGAPLPSGSGKGNVIINSPGILDLNARSVTINGLSDGGSGGGTVTSSTAGAATLTVGANDQTSTFSGVIQNGSGTIGLAKTGTGTLTLSGVNSYTGPTTVQNGTLALGSSGTISSNLVLGVSGGTSGTLDLTAKTSTFTQANVSGNGTIKIAAGQAINISTALTPGFGVGQLSFNGNLSLTSGTATTMELAGTVTPGTSYDNINGTGTLTLGGTLNIVASGAYDLTQPGTYNLFQASSFSGDFSSVTVGGTALARAGSLWTGTSGATSYSLSDATGVLTVVPEPSAIMALLGGTGVLLGLRRRRH